MPMLGKKDGANATDGSSYLEMVSFLTANGAKPDLQERMLQDIMGFVVKYARKYCCIFYDPLV